VSPDDSRAGQNALSRCDRSLEGQLRLTPRARLVRAPNCAHGERTRYDEQCRESRRTVQEPLAASGPAKLPATRRRRIEPRAGTSIGAATGAWTIATRFEWLRWSQRPLGCIGRILRAV